MTSTQVEISTLAQDLAADLERSVPLASTRTDHVRITQQALKARALADALAEAS